MTAIENFIKWCEEEIKTSQLALKQMQEGDLAIVGTALTPEGKKQTDETPEWIEKYKNRIPELMAIVARLREK